MANTKFMEPGTSATQDFSILTSNGGSTGNAGTGAITSDAQAVLSSVRSIKIVTGASDGSASVIVNGIMADAGRRVSFGFRFTGTPSPSKAGAVIASYANNGSQFIVLCVGLTSAKKLVLMDDLGNQLAIGSTVLTTNTDYRISFVYTITSKTINTFTLYINGVSEITATNYTLNNSGGDSFIFDTGDTGWTSGSNLTFYYAHFFVDDGTSGDPGNIRVTAKRPNANGTTNGFTTQIGSGGSGYGTGHSPQVNERPLSTTNGWSIASAGSAITEEYNIEGVSVGDNDLTGATIVDYMGWLDSKALVSETGKIIVNNVSTNIALTSTITLFTKIAGSATYPAGTGTDIGEISSTTVTTVSLYECGIIVAYTPAVAGTTHNLTLLGVGS